MIGGSLALALRQSEVGLTIVGYDASSPHANQALQQNIAQKVMPNLEELASVSDIIVLSSPLSTYCSIAEALSPYLRRGTIVTDVGSVKDSPSSWLSSRLPAHTAFIPGHPIAGRERSGPTAAVAELYHDRQIIITYNYNAPPDALALVQSMWEIAGGKVEMLDSKTHDTIFALTSHLPHLLAFATASVIDESLANTQPEIHTYFTTFLRIAASDPTMWCDIFKANSEQIIPQVDTFLALLEHIQTLDHADLKQFIGTIRDYRISVSTGRRITWFSHADSDSLWLDGLPMLISTLYVEIIRSHTINETSPLQHYIGGGFRDFSLPSLSDTNTVQQRIEATLSHPVSAKSLRMKLLTLRNLIISEDYDALWESLKQSRNSALKLLGRHTSH